MKLQNIIQRRDYIRETINISTVIKRVTRTTKLSQQQFTKKIYTTFYKWNRILSHFCIKKRWQTMTMYRLSKTQYNNSKKQISVTVDWEITEKTKKSQVIYKTRYLKRILQSLHQERKRMKTITNHEKYKTKWNNESHKKNERNKHEYCQSSETNNVQQNENVRTQDYARNELIMTTQFKNWLKMKKSYNEKLWMQNQTNLNEIINKN